MHTDDAPDFIEAAAPDPAAQASVASLAAELAKLRAVIDKAEEWTKKKKARVEEITTRELPDALVAAGLVTADGRASVTTDSGTVYLSRETYVRVNAGDKESFFAWLRSNGYEDIIREDVHPGTLKSFVKELREGGVALPDVVKINDVPTARLRKA